MFGFPFRRFALTILLSRGLRYVFWSLLGLFYGERAMELLKGLDAWSEKRLPMILAVAVALGVLGVSAHILRRRSRAATGASGSRRRLLG